MNRLIPLLLLLWTATPAQAEGTARVVLTPSAEIAERLASFRAALATGEWERDEAAALGAELLGARESSLRPATRWVVWPPEVAPVGALIAPWSPGRLVLEDVEIVYGPPGPVVPRDPGGRHALLVAPFTPGLPEVDDTPDPLLLALRSRVRRLDLLPRNDAGPVALRAALEDQAYALLLLRATPSWVLDGLGDAGGLPSLVGWWRPGRAPGIPDDEATLWAAAQRLLPPGGSMTVELWPRPESWVAAGWDRLVEELQGGESLVRAHGRARRALRSAEGATTIDWAGWILVGDGELRPSLPRRSWWQQFWGGRRRGSGSQKSGQ